MYNWIESTFGLTDGIARALAFGISLIVVLALFALFIFILKRLTGTAMVTQRGRQPRIAIMDAATVDTRRRLILVRRDNVEHLILVGGTTDVVVEQSIVRGAPLNASPPSPAVHRAMPPASPGSAAESPAAPAAAAQPHPTETGFVPQPVPEEPVDGGPRPAPAPVTQLHPPAPVAPPAATASSSPAAAPAAKAAKAASSFIRSAAGTFGNRGKSQIPAETPPPSAAISRGAAAERPGLRAVPASGAATAPAPKAPPVEMAAAADTPQAQPSASRVKSALETKKPSPDTGKPDASSVGSKTGLAGAFANPIAKASSALEKVARHTITPPASGPAAKARTALFSPLSQQQAEPAAARTEPSAPVAAPAETDSGRPQAPKPADKPIAAAPAEKTTADPSPAAVSAVTDTAASSNEPPLTEVKPAIPSAPAAAAPESPEPAAENQGSKPASDAEAAPADSTQMQSQKQAVEDTPPAAPAETKTTEQDTAAASKKPIERNPIEEEMAKLLDEIGGSQKT